jgi:hypothetical protein
MLITTLPNLIPGSFENSPWLNIMVLAKGITRKTKINPTGIHSQLKYPSAAVARKYNQATMAKTVKPVKTLEVPLSTLRTILE